MGNCWFSFSSCGDFKFHFRTISHVLYDITAALVIIGIIWLINHFTKKDDDNMSANSNFDQWHNWGENKEPRPKRKKVRDAKTKDVDK